jgi:hypothetical protein
MEVFPTFIIRADERDPDPSTTLIGEYRSCIMTTTASVDTITTRKSKSRTFDVLSSATRLQVRDRSPLPPASRASRPSSVASNKAATTASNVGKPGSTATKAEQKKPMPSQSGQTTAASQQGVARGDDPIYEGVHSDLLNKEAIVRTIVSRHWSLGQRTLQTPTHPFGSQFKSPPNTRPLPSQVRTAVSLHQSPRDHAVATLSSTSLSLQYNACNTSSKANRLEIATSHIVHVSRVLNPLPKPKYVLVYYRTDAGSVQSLYISFESVGEANKWFLALMCREKQKTEHGPGD